MKDLQGYIAEINSIFRSEHDRRKAHARCRPILLEMAKDQDILREIIRYNLKRPGFLEQKRINPVIALNIEENETVSFVAHCWLPLPDKDTNTTHQSIHHHGKLLLTSVAAFGPGYESVIFKKGFSINKGNAETDMKAEKVYRNELLNLEFIESNTPHVVFYPPSFSITYALWTNEQSSASESVKKIGFISRYKKPIRKLIDLFGASGLLGLNKVEYIDFYPSGGKILAMRSRIMYPAGGNKSFIKGFFHLLQQVGFNDPQAIKASMEDYKGDERELLQRTATSFFSNEKIDDDFEAVHRDIEFINIKKKDLAQALDIPLSA